MLVKRRWHLSLVLAALCLPSLAMPAGALAQPASADMRTQARALWTRSQDAVVTAQIVVKMSVSMGGRPMESEEIRAEIPATLVDQGGLAVVSLASIDPGGLLKQILPKMPGASPEIESSLTEAKLRLADGREIAAEVVLRDVDLDLAFLRPTEVPASPLPFIDLARGATVDVLDDVVVLTRLRRVGDWAPGVLTDRVWASVAKPRPYVVLASQDAAQEPGHPVFTPAGDLVGILAVRTVPGDSAGGFLAMTAAMGKGLNALRIVVPVHDLREVAKQAAAKAR